MLEAILLVNLAFSVVGFFFILRMWKEVKTRRDFYGENFGIPRGNDMTQPPIYMQPAQVQQPQQQQISTEQINAVLAAMQQQQQPVQAVEQSQDGDLQKLVAAAIAAQNGGV